MTLIVKAKAIYAKGKVEFAEPDKAPPDGTPILIQYEVPKNKGFAAHFGVLSREDGESMLAAIEDACERIDRDEW